MRAGKLPLPVPHEVHTKVNALAARNVPLRRIVLSGGAKSYGFSLGAFK